MEDYIARNMFNRKKLTVPCDKCGARLENIPEKCPHCGEIIRDRMDPEFRQRVEQMMNSKTFLQKIFRISQFLFFIPLLIIINLLWLLIMPNYLGTIVFSCAFVFISLAYSLRVLAKSKLQKKITALVFGSMFLLLLLGVISNLAPKENCEIITAKWLYDDVLNGTPFNIRTNATYSKPFDEIGAKYTINKNIFPWAYVQQSKNVFPFIVSVDWGWQLAPQYGEGGKRIFISIFGIININIGDRIMWLS